MCVCAIIFGHTDLCTHLMMCLMLHRMTERGIARRNKMGFGGQLENATNMRLDRKRKIVRDEANDGKGKNECEQGLCSFNFDSRNRDVGEQHVTH